MQWLHGAHTDFKRTRLFYKMRHQFFQFDKKHAVAEAFGVGALVSGVVIFSLPAASPTPAKSPRDAAVDNFKARRSQQAPEEITEFDSTPHPKLPGDRIPRSTANATRRSGTSSTAWSSSARASGSRRGVVSARAQKRDGRGQHPLPEEGLDSDRESDADEASMSA